MITYSSILLDTVPGEVPVVVALVSMTEACMLGDTANLKIEQTAKWSNVVHASIHIVDELFKKEIQK